MSIFLQKSLRRAQQCAVILGCAFMCLTGSVNAVEGGSGLYAPGYITAQAGLMPEPGTYFSYNFYSYKGDDTTNINTSGPVDIPGTSLTVDGALNARIDATVDSYAHLFSVTHVFKETVWGGHAGIALLVPYVNTDLDLDGSGVLTLTGSGGNSYDFELNGQASESNSGVGDISISALLGWHDERLHYMAILNVYAPTGDYDTSNAVNVGRNHWAIEPMASVTYLNEATGLELSSAAGITFNQENSDTHYKSGDEFHLDVAGIQHFSEKLYLGVVGYAYNQLSGDSGSGASSSYKGEVYAVGPIAGGSIAVGEQQSLYVNARYYFESGAENRLEGDAFYLAASMKF